MDEQSAPLRGPHVLSTDVRRADRTHQRAAGGEEPRLDDSLRGLHVGGDGDAGPFRRRVGAVPPPSGGRSGADASDGAQDSNHRLSRLAGARGRILSGGRRARGCRLRGEQGPAARVGAERDASFRVRQAAAGVRRADQAVRHARPQRLADSLRPAGSDRARRERQRNRKAAGDSLAAGPDRRLAESRRTMRCFASRIWTCCKRWG